MDGSKAFQRWKKPMIAAAIIGFLYTIVGFFALPAVLERVLPERLSAALNRQVTLEKVRFNPYALSITLEKMTVAGAGGGLFAGFDRLHANLQISSLVHRGVVLKEVRLDGLEANIVRTGERRFNFSDLIRPSASPPAPAEKRAGPPPFRVVRFAAAGKRIAFDDRHVGSRHRLEDIDLVVENLSSLPADAQKETSATLQVVLDGAAVSIEATAQPFAPHPSATAAVAVEKLEIPHYLSYLPAKPAATIRAAVFGASLQIGYQTAENADAALTLSGSMKLTGLDIADRRKRPLLQVPGLSVRIGNSNLLAPELVVEKIRVDAPEAVVVRGSDGELNVLDLVPDIPATGEEGQPEETKSGFSLRVNSGVVSGGKVRFEDRLVGGGFETSLSGIEASLEGFSPSEETPSRYRLAFSTDAQESVALEGAFSLSPMEAEARFDVRDIDLARYVPYAADRIRFEVRGGRLSLAGRLTYADQPEAPSVRLEAGEAALRSLVLYRTEDQDKVVFVPRLDVGGAAFSLQERSLSLETLSTEGGEVSYLRYPDGRINLAELVHFPEEDAPASEPNAPFRFFIDRVRIGDYRTRMEDRVPMETVVSGMSDIRIELDGLTNSAGKTADVRLGFLGSRGGRIDLGGKVGLDPLTADLQVNVDRADIRAFQPYFTDRVRIIVTGGTASAEGRFVLDAAGHGVPKIRYTGRAEINGFKSVDKEDALEFVDWESLLLEKIDFKMPPMDLAIAEVGLTGLYSRLIIDEDGTMNVTDALSAGQDESGPTASEEAAEPAETPAPPKEKRLPEAAENEEKAKVDIRTVTLQNGHINFTDRFNPFNFAGDLTRIGGRVSGLTTLETEKADVLMEGSWENRAPLEIKGKVNPLAERRFADLTLTIRDIDLSPFSPYSGKFLGYKLEKGLLTLELGYLLEGSHLKGDNRAYFEELTLGERVDSASAVTLPVSLAVSLLKDPSGAITLDVPVEGDLNDPQFSLGRTILRVLGNLIVKIISSPFAFLGSLAGGEEELSFVEFEPGGARVTAEAEEKLDALTDALLKRPALKLNIQGDADPEADPEALRRKKFENLVRSQKLREMTGRGETAVPLDQIELSAEEYPVYLKKAYDAAPFAKPRDADGNIKQLPPEEMEKLLLTQFVFTEHDLRQLAVERADAVKSYMLENSQVDAGRLFIIEPNIPAAAADPETAVKSRVRFSLR